MAETWIVAADSARARLFVADKPLGPLREIETLAHPEGRLHERDLTSDSPGRSFDRAGDGRHAMEPTTTARRAEATAFAREIAARLDAARTQHRFARLIVAAPPAFLGLLRDQLTTETSRCVIHEISKSLAQMPAAELRRHLPERLWSLDEGT